MVADPGREEVAPAGIVRAQMAALGLDFARGGLLTLAGLIVGGGLANALSGTWPLISPSQATISGQPQRTWALFPGSPGRSRA